MRWDANGLAVVRHCHTLTLNMVFGINDGLQNGRTEHNHSLINSKPKQRYVRIELKHT